jgi:plastocyanin
MSRRTIGTPARWDMAPTRVRFTRTGTFSYRCTIHEAEGMRGKIVVH